jgi:hypothetical protein
MNSNEKRVCRVGLALWAVVSGGLTAGIAYAATHDDRTPTEHVAQEVAPRSWPVEAAPFDLASASESLASPRAPEARVKRPQPRRDPLVDGVCEQRELQAGTFGTTVRYCHL